MKKSDFNNSVKQLSSVIKAKNHEVMESVNSSKNPTDVAINLLVKELGLNPDKAYMVAHRFMLGFETYDQHRSADFKLEDSLLLQLNGYSEEERKEYLTNVLLSLESVDFITNSTKLNIKEVEWKKQIYSTLSVENLLKKIVKKSKDNYLTNKVVDIIDQIPLPHSIENISDVINKRRNHFRYAVAALLYIESQKGNILLFKEQCYPTDFQLGAIAAGAVELMKVNGDFVSGKIEKSTWRNIIEAIMSALIMIVVGAVVALAIIGSVAFIMHAVSLILGTSVFACALAYYFLCCPLLIVTVCGTIGNMEDFSDLINKKIEEFFNVIAEFFSRMKIVKTINESSDCEQLVYSESSVNETEENAPVYTNDINVVSC